MLSIPDMAIIGVVALLVFGPDQLPKVARRAGQIVRDVQNTSQGFIREMERAAEESPAFTSASLEHPDPPGLETSGAETSLPYAMEPLAREPAKLAPAPHEADTWSPLSAAPSYHEAPPPAPSSRAT